MSTFSGIVKEFPRVQIDNFRLYEDHQPPLACFLSHIHSDHLTNLESIRSPFVYCTAPTRELLLRLEKYPHRMNFAKGILEVTKQTYRRVKRLLKPIPLETPTVIGLTHNYSIQATLFDANHCTGACMFLLEGNGKAILYTGDVRSEPWWVNSLVRNPVMIPYAKGHKRLDNIYLDTTFAMGDALRMDFPTKADGLAEVLAKVSEYPKDTTFYLDTWTFGYEEVWIALSKVLHTQVHLCDYRYKVYNSMKNVPECFSPHSASLLGYQLGNSYHQGCLTKNPDNVRLHSCERGTQCEVFKNFDVVRITPIITRHEGKDVAEIGAGGGQGDLDQTHELDLNAIVMVSQLSEKFKSQPNLQAGVTKWIDGIIKSGRSTIKLDFDGFWDELLVRDEEEDLDDIPMDRLALAIANLFTRKPGEGKTVSKQITFPFSRHSSYNELRCLVEAFRPKDIYPCTVAKDTWTTEVSMKTLFGDLCSSDDFAHDQRMVDLKKQEQIAVLESESLSQESVNAAVSRSRNKKRELQLESSDASTITTTSTKKTKIVHSSPTCDPSIPANNLGLQTTIPPKARTSDETITPSIANTRTSQNSAPTESLAMNSRERAARRIRIAKAVQDGAWQGLRSVVGYHNQEFEDEL